MRNILIVGVVLIVGAGVIFYLFPSDQRRIKRQFKSLEQWVEKQGEETQLVSASKMRSLKALMAPTCSFNIPAHDLSGSHSADEIAQKGVMGRSRYSSLSLAFYDLEVDMLEERQAKVTVTARLSGIAAAEERIEETHELECLLQKIDNTWVFSAVEVVDVLQK